MTRTHAVAWALMILIAGSYMAILVVAHLNDNLRVRIEHLERQIENLERRLHEIRLERTA